MTVRNVDEARRKAAEVLASHGVQQVPVDVEKLASAAGISVVYEALEDHASGMLVRDADSVVIGVNSQHPAPKQRFTIAHELAHYFLHAQSPTVFIDDADELPGVDESHEIEANAFASALLMPETAVAADLRNQPVDLLDYSTVEALAGRYQVSPHALTIRLIELGLLAGLSFDAAGRESDNK